MCEWYVKSRHVPSRQDSPIHTFVVALGADNLWRKIIGRAAKSPSDVWNFFGKSKISNLEMSMTIQQQVLRLKVAVDDVHAVKVIQSQCYLGSVELRYRIGETLDRLVSMGYKSRLWNVNGSLVTFVAS